MTNPQPRWNRNRFLKTLAFFHVIPFVGSLDWLFPTPAVIAQSDRATTESSRTLTIFDFTLANPDLPKIWGAVDDVVMGGVSESTLQFNNGVALFSGVVSTANSGGFVSARTRNFSPFLDLSAYKGIELRVKGDGQRYKFFLRSTSGWDSLAYAYSFDTPRNRWTNVRIPFEKLIPVFRAKTVPDAAPFNSAEVTSMQLMLSKFEYDGGLNPRFRPGSFQLQVKTIKAYR